MESDADATLAGRAGLPDLAWRALGVNLCLSCAVPRLRNLLSAHWQGMVHDVAKADAPTFGELRYEVFQAQQDAAISIQRPGQATIWAEDEGDFLYQLETDAIIALQLIRTELYFLHAAVAEVNGAAALLVAESGGGKSTTLWGMLHHGWRYLSDELAPVDLETMCVFPYPRSLSLKRRPPSAYPLPDASFETPRTLHVPVHHLPAVSDLESCPLGCVYFVHYLPDATAPTIKPVSMGETSARLYANALNPLAHDNAGLAAVSRIAKRIPGFILETADLAASCRVISSHRS